MHQKHSFELVKTEAIDLPDSSVLNADRSELTGGTFAVPIAAALNTVRQHGLAQVLGTCNATEQFNDDDYQKAYEGAFRALLDDIQLDGERIDFDIKWSKTYVAVITLRRGKQPKHAKDRLTD